MKIRIGLLVFCVLSMVGCATTPPEKPKIFTKSLQPEHKKIECDSKTKKDATTKDVTREVKKSYYYGGQIYCRKLQIKDKWRLVFKGKEIGLYKLPDNQVTEESTSTATTGTDAPENANTENPTSNEPKIVKKISAGKPEIFGTLDLTEKEDKKTYFGTLIHIVQMQIKMARYNLEDDKLFEAYYPKGKIKSNQKNWYYTSIDGTKVTWSKKPEDGESLIVIKLKKYPDMPLRAYYNLKSE